MAHPILFQCGPLSAIAFSITHNNECGSGGQDAVGGGWGVIGRGGAAGMAALHTSPSFSVTSWEN